MPMMTTVLANAIRLPLFLSAEVESAAFKIARNRAIEQADRCVLA